MMEWLINNVLGKIGKDAVVDSFMVLSHSILRGTEKNHENSQYNNRYTG
jgi:hypothetical protein